LRIAEDVIVASLRHAVANKMRHLVTQKAFEGKRIEQLDRLLPDDNLASPVYGSAGRDIAHVETSGENIHVRNRPAVRPRDVRMPVNRAIPANTLTAAVKVLMPTRAESRPSA